MTTSIRTLLLLLLLTLSLSACRDKAPSADPGVKDKPPQAVAKEEVKESDAKRVVKEEPKENPDLQKNPLVWVMEDKENGSKTYLLGTIHIGFDAEKSLPKEVWAQFDASKNFVMETDLTKSNADMLKRTTLPKGESLKKQIGPEAWAVLDKMMGGMAKQFDRVKPWFVVSMLLMKMIPHDLMTSPMDQVLHSKAKREEKALGYLETPEQQIDVLEKTIGKDELQEMLLEFEKQKGELAQMMEAYKKGDVKKIEELSFTQLEKKPQMYDLLFFKRNKAWIPKIISYSKKPEDTFIAFGAGHLMGKEGVLELLRKEGYEPKRFSLK